MAAVTGTSGTPSQRKLYLGDGVYVDWDGYHIVLTTEDGVTVTNAVYLEPAVYRSLTVWVEHLTKAKA